MRWRNGGVGRCIGDGRILGDGLVWLRVAVVRGSWLSSGYVLVLVVGLLVRLAVVLRVRAVRVVRRR